MRAGRGLRVPIRRAADRGTQVRRALRAGVFYAATAAGTALILGCLGVCLGLLSAGNLELYSPAARVSCSSAASSA